MEWFVRLVMPWEEKDLVWVTRWLRCRVRATMRKRGLKERAQAARR
jgi:hypothetical protein